MADKKQKGSLLTRSDHNYFLPFVIIITAVAALWLLFFSHSSVLNWVRANWEIQRQERQMDQLRRDIDAMDAEIRSLRETYHFAAPGDDVYLIE